MRTRNLVRLLAPLALLSTLNPQLSTSLAAPLGTAFTYQGRLREGNSSADGLYDLQFRLYDAATHGLPVGDSVFLEAMPVKEGLFSVDLDFGLESFDGKARWLQINVGTHGTKPLIPLSPRQVIAPTPYALFARGASNALFSATAGSVAASNLVASAEELLLLTAPSVAVECEHYTNAVIGSASRQVGMHAEDVVGGNLGVTAGGTYSLTTGMNVTEWIGRSRNTEVTVDDTLTVGSSLVVDVGNNLTVACAQDGLWSAGNKLNLTASDELRVESGAASMVMKKSGDIAIQGKRINIKGTGQIAMSKGAAFKSAATETNETVIGAVGESAATNGIGLLGIATSSLDDDVHAGLLAVADAGNKRIALLANTVTNDLLPASAVPRPAALAARVHEKQDLIQGYSNGDELRFRVSDGGTVYAAGTAVQPVDLAERIPVSELIEPAEVVEVDPDHPGAFRRARQAYSPGVVGVISTQPGYLLGHDESRSDNASRPPMALAGRVPVKVNLEGGVIHPGDLLASSSTPGHAMKAREPWRGTVLGTALEGFDGATGTAGKIEVLVHLAPGAALAAALEPLRVQIEAQEARITALEDRIRNLTFRSTAGVH